ncbi:hypothetical protein PVL30_004015 [Lodderomyces elongisporus]|uniref:uncharacterized protein n=1 Tax=Lodderomyces elongisporus TaxID=36914 RepID=UPI002920EB39|nr:uncharacterized protein PVL30_004015 [Lodderomyces elongisporus]WLF80239.1 hypothetical protein PVL30_004015 [Lodderomyces elongisporus]
MSLFFEENQFKRRKLAPPSLSVSSQYPEVINLSSDENDEDNEQEHEDVEMEVMSDSNNDNIVSYGITPTSIKVQNGHNSNREPIVIPVGDEANNNGKGGNEGNDKDDVDDDDDDIIIMDKRDVSGIRFKSPSFNSQSFRPESHFDPDVSNSQAGKFNGDLTELPAGSSLVSKFGDEFGHYASNSSPTSQNLPSLDNFTMPGAFNAPAPVPHADQDLTSIQRDELKKRSESKLTMVKDLIESKGKISSQMQLHQAQYDTQARNNQKLQQQLAQANAMGRHDLVSQIRGLISKVQRQMEGPRNYINNLQKSLFVVEAKLHKYQTELSFINNKIRQLGHTLNAAFNPYEAQIADDYHHSFSQQASSSNMQGTPADLDLQSLLDNIKPEDTLEEGLAPTPREMTVKLLKHQRIGLTWLQRMESSKTKGGVLADDMGLGKTIQTLALIVSRKSDNPSCKTTLIIAPVSLLRQWAAEIQSKLHPQSNLNVGIFHGDEKKEMSTFSAMKKYDVVLTSYGTLASEWKKHFAEELQNNQDKGKKFYPRAEGGGISYISPFYASYSKFYRIVLDEAQNIKNKFALASKAVIYLKGEYRLCLSGTPMQNSIEELYPVVRFLKIRPYYIEEKFRADLIIPLKSKNENYDDVDRSRSMRKLRALLSSIMLRRNKNSLIDGQPILQLPEKHLISDFVELEGEEKDYYSSLESGIQKVARKVLDNGDKSSVLTMLLRLRQACCHSYLVEIGQIKKEREGREAEDGLMGAGGIKSDWRQQLKLIAGISDSVRRSVVERMSLDNIQFTCPVCYDAVDSTGRLAIFTECGHIICQACVNEFFENNMTEDEQRGSTRIAECLDCKTHVKNTNVADYAIFNKLYIQQMDVAEVERHCRVYYAKKQISNISIIKELTKRDQGFEASAKIEKAIELINNIQQANPSEKIIIFSQFTTLFDLMKLVLDHLKILHLRYDGSMTVEAKNNVIKQFYQSNCNVLLLSLRAGNVGLTLTCANHVIIMDPFWNPFVEEQAMDRAHRIGQEKEVHVHRVLITNTVESRIMELQERKKELIGDALNENEMKSISKLGRRELGFLFGLNTLEE